MKKLMAVLMALVLAVGMVFTAVAEEESQPITCEIVEGSYVITVPVEEGDENWAADEMAQDDSVVRLASAEYTDGKFVVTYAPVADGQVTVYVRHLNGVACDQLHGFDLKVEGGKVTESTGGSYTASPSDEEMEEAFAGEWLEKDTQFNTLTITRNETAGFDFEMVSPISHDACLLKGTVLYDCELDCFVTTDAQMFNLPVEDGAEPKLAAPVVGCRIMPIENEEGGIELALAWYAEELGDDQEIVFVK